MAEALLDQPGAGEWSITGIDNFSRNGSWLNRDRLAARGIRVIHGDIRNASDLEALGPFDFVIDAAANPSVLAGVDGKSSSRQLVEHNLAGTINLLEACKAWKAGFILLSTSRVYSIPPLASVPVEIHNRAYRPVFSDQVTGGRGQEAWNSSQEPRTGNLQVNAEKLKTETLKNSEDSLQFSSNQEPATRNQEPCSSSSLLASHFLLGTPGLSPAGISESFSTAPPVSLYGSTKITSEALALEYGLTFDFPVWINRCGVMAGARQFGKPDQGIFAFWIHSWREGRPLKYIGFDGLGHQVRDCLHPRDLAPLLIRQIGRQGTGDRRQGSNEFSSSSLITDHCSLGTPRIINLSGGVDSAMSLRQLSDWCAARFPSSTTASSLPPVSRPLSPEVRPFDLPWVVLDPSLAANIWNWQPATPVASILDEIATFAEANPDWLATSA